MIRLTSVWTIVTVVGLGVSVVTGVIVETINLLVVSVSLRVTVRTGPLGVGAHSVVQTNELPLEVGAAFDREAASKSIIMPKKTNILGELVGISLES